MCIFLPPPLTIVKHSGPINTNTIQGGANMAKLYTISRSTHGVGGWFDKKGVSTHGY